MVTIKSLVQFCNEDGSHVVEIKKKVDKEKVLAMHETDVKVWKEMEVALWGQFSNITLNLGLDLVL